MPITARNPGVKFYTHLSDRYAPFHTKVIAWPASEAAHVLDGLLYHQSEVAARRHHTDCARRGAISRSANAQHDPQATQIPFPRARALCARAKREPLAAVFGGGSASSSDGQFFRAGGFEP